MMNNKIYDITIIGGGINGAGIAALLGNLKTSGLNITACLIEQGDFASQTSSSSTKLIHGGLRYLEHYDFKLVRSALTERKVLECIAPHMIWPLEFIFINNKSIRNKYKIRLGLWLYDILAGFNNYYNKTQCIDLTENNIINKFYKNINYNNYRLDSGYIYTDLWGDDSRLVISNIMQAKNHKIDLFKKTKLIDIQYDQKKKYWDLEAIDTQYNKSILLKSKLIINATGPWVNSCLENIFKFKPNYNIKLIKGSHLVVTKQYDHNKSYVLQLEDNRILFIIPYENNCTLIGTTEVEINYNNNSLDKKNYKITEQETEYLIKNYNNYFNKTITKTDVIYSYSGIRPLFSDEDYHYSENTRDYKIDVYSTDQLLVNIYGGKITTYRILAKKVVSKSLELLNLLNKKTLTDLNNIYKLPGSDIIININNTYKNYNQDYHKVFISKLKQEYSFLSDKLLARYTRTYGSLVYKLLANVYSLEDMGYNLGSQYNTGNELYQKEIEYLIIYEFADCLEDILWRRTKLGLYLTRLQKDRCDSYINFYLDKIYNS